MPLLSTRYRDEPTFERRFVSASVRYRGRGNREGAMVVVALTCLSPQGTIAPCDDCSRREQEIAAEMLADDLSQEPPH